MADCIKGAEGEGQQSRLEINNSAMTALRITVNDLAKVIAELRGEIAPETDKDMPETFYSFWSNLDAQLMGLKKTIDQVIADLRETIVG